MSISFWCEDFVVVWKKFWNDNYLFEVELLQYFLQLRNLSRAARKAFTGRVRTADRIGPTGRMLCRPVPDNQPTARLKILQLTVRKSGSKSAKMATLRVARCSTEERSKCIHKLVQIRSKFTIFFKSTSLVNTSHNLSASRHNKASFKMFQVLLNYAQRLFTI